MRPVCEIHRQLASADPSVALVCSMHPAVVAFWLASPDPSQPDWEEQRNAVFASAAAGEQWGTITSEPGSGGDINRTRAVATPGEAEPFLAGRSYAVTGDKHFGSGSGVTDRMMTTAIPEGESEPTIFALDVRGRPVGRKRRAEAHRRVGRHGHGSDPEPRHAPRVRARGSAGVERGPRADHAGGRTVHRSPLHRRDTRRAGCGDRARPRAAANQGGPVACVRTGRVGAGRAGLLGRRAGLRRRPTCRRGRQRCCRPPRGAASQAGGRGSRRAEPASGDPRSRRRHVQ